MAKTWLRHEYFFLSQGSSGKTVIATLKHVFLHIKETNLWDLLLGVTCIVILLGLRVSNAFGFSLASIGNCRINLD